MRVIFSKIADQTYREVLTFLSNVWTEKEMYTFISDTSNVVDQLENGRFKHYQKSILNTRSALIGKKHIRMFFRKETEDQILILLFFDMRQDPQKILDLLK